MKVEMLDVPKFMKVLYLMQNLSSFNYMDLYVKIKMTYSHYSKLLKIFEQVGWLTLARDGRSGVATITEEGMEIVAVIAPAVEKLKPFMDKVEQEKMVSEYVF